MSIEQLKAVISNIKPKIHNMRTTNIRDQNENANLIQEYYEQEKRNIVIFGKQEIRKQEKIDSIVQVLHQLFSTKYKRRVTKCSVKIVCQKL